MTKQEYDQFNASIEKILSCEGLISSNEKDNVRTIIKKFVHHADTTVGLWATDVPDKVSDPNNLLFQITF